MPTLRQLENGRSPDIWLDLRQGAGGRVPPLSLGPRSGGERHLQIPRAGVEARLLGSSTTRSFVLGGSGMTIAGHPLEGIRVLRHGDLIGMAGAELLYLDVSARQLQPKAATARCFSPTCYEPGGSQGYISCPWCARLYHTSCWLALEDCAERGCYPIRRLLLAELVSEVTPGKMEADRDPRHADAKLRVCTARCSSKPEVVLIEPGAEVLRCPRCDSPYHPSCFLSIRDRCLKCDHDLRRLVARLVFRDREEGAS